MIVTLRGGRSSYKYPGPRRRGSWLGRLVIWSASLYAVLLVVLSVMHEVRPARTGFLALSEVLAPYFFVPLLVAVPLALARGAALLRVALLVCLLVFCVRFPPRLVAATPQATPGAIHLSVMNWNVAARWHGGIVEVLRDKPASIAAIVEADWWQMSADPELAQVYPYRWGVQPDHPVSGQAIFTTYPIIESGVMPEETGGWNARTIWARLDVGLGRNVIVVASHPPPGRTCSRHTFPRKCYDTTLRDRQLAAIRSFVEPYLRQGDALLLLGDFNVTEREPAYGELAAGLVDAHRAVGVGTGTTWRPSPMMDRPFALLRIDYIFSSPNVTPLSSSVDCTPRGSDHCIVYGTFEVR